MGIQRRRRAEREARQEGNAVTSRADIESEYLEKADAPLRKQEFTTKAFNVMWIDFFKLFAALAAAACLFVAVRSLYRRDPYIAGFQFISLFVFITGRNWLSTVDVILNDPAGLFGSFSNEFRVFLFAVFLQMLVLPVLHLTGHPPDKWSKCFPSGIVFLGVALLVVAYMRHSLRKTVKHRSELSKKLFGH